MKKALVILLAFALVLSMTSIAFAGVNGNYHFKKKPITFKIQANLAKVDQKASIDNKAIAKSGDAYAIGNVSKTVIFVNNNVNACHSKADNEVKIEVENEGKAIAKTGDAKAENEKIKNEIEQKAEVDQENEVED